MQFTTLVRQLDIIALARTSYAASPLPPNAVFFACPADEGEAPRLLLMTTVRAL